MKIKYLIDTILSPKIQTLDFVDRYAGIVRTINIAEGNGTETGIVKRYPLACNVTGVDCANIGIYQNLVPDDTKKSVIYWEMVSPMTNGGMTKTRDFYRKKFKGTARLVVWLNLAKLGIDNCTDSILVLPILEKEITTKGKITGGIYDGDLLWIEPLRMVNQDINTIFGKYDYNKLKNYYLYPFDFFAIDVQFTLEQCLSKGGVWPCILPLDCPNSGPVTCKSLNFDGVNEYIDCTNNAAFNQDFDTAFSVSAWVKFDTIATVNILFSKFNPSPKGWQLRLQNNTVSLFLKHATGGQNQIHAFGTTIINIGAWYHLTATYDGSNTLAGVKLYVNGSSDIVTGAGGSVVGTFQNTEPLLLGQTTNGNIASARMWNTELSAAEILEEYNGGEIKSIPVNNANVIVNPALNCATWNGTGYDIPDDSGITTGYTSVNSEEIDLQNDCPNDPLPVTCKSLNLDGVNEYINCTNNSDFDIEGNESFSFVCNIKKLGGSFLPLVQKLYYNGANTQKGYRFYIGPTNKININLYGSSAFNNITIQSTAAITVNNWYNIAITYGGTETAAGLKVYINGVLSAFSIIVDSYGGSMINTEILTLGGQPTPTNPIYGNCNFAAAQMWKTELTETEILNFYNYNINTPQKADLILSTDIGNALWNGSEFNIPDLTGITTGYTSVNSEQIDLTNECP